MLQPINVPSYALADPRGFLDGCPACLTHDHAPLTTLPYQDSPSVRCSYECPCGEKWSASWVWIDDQEVE